MIDVVPKSGMIKIGKQGENRAIRVILPNIRAGSGSILLLHQRALDKKPYPVPVAETAEGIIWVVSSTDTANQGRGQAELQWLGENGEVVKSVTYQTETARSLSAPGAVPDEPMKPYVQAVAQDAQAAKDAAASATEAARIAEASATQAGAAASSAADSLKRLEDGIASGEFRGEKGDKGDPGEKGEKGEKGDRGDVGPAGDTTAADAAAEAAKKAAQEAQKAAEDCTGKVNELKEDLGGIATVGENLFNHNGTRYSNSRIDNFGNVAAGDDNSIVYELPIGGGDYVSNMPTNGVYKISCISKDGVATIVIPSTTSDFEEHFTVPDGTVKVYMSFWSGRDSDTESNDYIIFKKGMIVSGDNLPNKYIPYYKKLNDVIKVNESNIEDGTKLNKYIDTEALSEEASNALFNRTLNLIDSISYVRGTLVTNGFVAEQSDSTANYIYTIKIPDGTFIGMNAVPQTICFYDENMDFLESKQLADTSDDTVSVSVPAKSKYAKLSYWYGRGVDGSFEHVTHLKDISVTVDSVPFSAIKREPVLDSSHKISSDNLCDGFEISSKLAKGIKWYILGDSRSVDLAYTTKFYHDYLCEKHKFIRKKNLAVSGARIRSADTAYHSLLEQYPSVGDDADLITVYAGINDYGQDNPTEIGTEGSTDLTTFYGAFESLITNLITNHPTAKIVVITPIPQFNFEINNTIIWGDRNDTNSLGKSLDDYCNVIKKICRKYGVFVKDACYESGITPRIASQRSEYFKDGLHHNEKGQLVLAEYLSDIFDLLDC